MIAAFAVAGCGKGPAEGGKSEASAARKSAEELCYEIRYGDDPKKVADLLDAGADINGRDPNGFTPLVMAVMSGSGGSDEAQVKIVDLLLDRGADPNLDCPLCAAAQTSKPALITKLLDRGADINGRNPAGLTPLMAAVDVQSFDIVKVLLDRGANADVKEQRGRNAWKLAFNKAYSFQTADAIKIEELLRRRTNRADIENLLRSDASIKDSMDVEKWLQTHK